MENVNKNNEEKKSNIDEKFIKQAQKLAREAQILPGGIEALAQKLQNAQKEGRPLRVKLGLDPTRPDLHLGHTVVMRKLRMFQELGHKVVLIVGGATAMVGDPSGKSETRPNLSKEQVEENAATYFEQMSKVVCVEDAEVTNNAQWLHSLSFIDLLKLASSTTVAQMLAREDFANRYRANRPISIHEFMYPLMQGYDSVVVDADIELGGTDQMFNLLLGREIQEFYGKSDPQLAMLLPLIEGTDGEKKMSKTYPEHCISLTDNPYDMYGKIMSIPDKLILRYYSLLLDVADEDVQKIHQRLQNEPMEVKSELAFKIVEEYCGGESAKEAQEEFNNVVRNKKPPSEMEEVKLEAPVVLTDFMVQYNLAPSKSEAKRLIKSNAVKLNGEKITDIDFKLDKEGILQVGKRRFVKITL